MADSVNKSGEDALVFLLKSTERFPSLVVRWAISSGCDRYVSLTIRETFNGGMVSNVFFMQYQGWSDTIFPSQTPTIIIVSLQPPKYRMIQ